VLLFWPGAERERSQMEKICVTTAWNETYHLVSVQRAEGGLLAGADGTDGKAGGGQITSLGDGHAGGENDQLILEKKKLKFN
jgi:hypothetical protein